MEGVLMAMTTEPAEKVVVEAHTTRAPRTRLARRTQGLSSEPVYSYHRKARRTIERNYKEDSC